MALAVVTAPAAYGWDSFAPIPIDEFGGSSVPDGYVFGGYSFSAGQNLDTTYNFNSSGVAGRNSRRCPMQT